MIYFIQQGHERGPIKIGYTGTADSVKQRLSTLQIGSAEPLVLLAAVDGTLAEERHLHQRFEDHRLRGEWFECTDELYAATRSKVAAQDLISEIREPAKQEEAAVLYELTQGEAPPFEAIAQRIAQLVFEVEETDEKIQVYTEHMRAMEAQVDKLHKQAVEWFDADVVDRLDVLRREGRNEAPVSVFRQAGKEKR